MHPLPGTARHAAAIVDGGLYDGRAFGGTADGERKARSVRVPRRPADDAAALPEFDPARMIPPPAA